MRVHAAQGWACQHMLQHTQPGIKTQASSTVLAHLPKDAARVWPVLLHDSDVTCSLWGLARPNMLLLLPLCVPVLLLLLVRRLLLETAVRVNKQRADSCSSSSTVL